MRMAQYNFKVDDELEAKVKKALEDSGHNGKTAFLEDMVSVYSSHLANRVDSISEKIASYIHINESTKEGLEKLFSHLLSTMDYNFSIVAQEQQRIEKERAEVNQRAIELDSLVDKLKLEFIEEKNVLELSYKEELEAVLKEKKLLEESLVLEREELVKAREEVSSLSTIAEQTSLVIEENKELRTLLSSNEQKYKEELLEVEALHKDVLNRLRGEKEELVRVCDDLEMKLRDEEKKHFITSHELERCREDLVLVKENSLLEIEKFKQGESLLQGKIGALSEELADLSSKYNQLLGKVEVFELLKDKK